MNSQANSVVLSLRSRPTTPLQDEAMEVRPDVGTRPDSDEVVPRVEMLCDYVDETLFTKRGAIIQFINGNCAGSPSTIGGMRLPVKDVRKVPAYLARNKDSIKVHAMKHLTKHFIDMQCSIGATDVLTADDYGMTFSLASVSQEGANLNPSKRNEGPLLYCCFSGLNQPIVLTHSDWGQNYPADVTHVINCYIHLLPSGQRRRKVIEKHLAVMTTVPIAKMNGGIAKKPRIPTTPNAYRIPKKAQQESYEVKRLKKELAELKLTKPFPPLPTSAPVMWPTTDGCPNLPDE